jgi:hypothetical protein
MRDEGSYDYLTVNKVSIAAINDMAGEAIGEEITVTAASMLRLAPVMAESVAESGDDYRYRWYIYRQGIARTEEITISEERDLEWPVTAAPARYTAVFVVTNAGTGVSSTHEFTITVVKQNIGTLMVASSVDDEADITVMNPAGEWIPGIYATANGDGGRGRAVWVTDTRLFQTEAVDNSILLTEGGGAFFDNTGFRDTETFDQMFYDVPAAINPQAYYRGYVYYGFEDQLEFLINDGKLHYRIATMVSQGAKFTTPMASPFEGDYSMNPCAIVHNGSYLFYDNINCRFLLVTADFNIYPGYDPDDPYNYDVPDSYEYTVKLQSAYLYESYGYNPEKVAAFDPDDVGLEMIWFGSTYINREDIGYALMRNPANRNELWRLKFFAGGLGFIDYYNDYANYWDSHWKFPIAAQTGIADAKSFTISRNNPYIYYCVGSKVYLYNVENDNNRMILDVATIVPGAEVDHLYIQNAGMNRAEGDEDLNYRLYIAVSPPAGTGRCGSIIDTRLMLNGEYESHVLHENVTGKVVSMDHQM